MRFANFKPDIPLIKIGENLKYRKIPRNKMQEGIDLCKKNILDFLEDARLIVKAGRLNHAFVSVQFAIEELGKILMLREAFEKSNFDPIPIKVSVFRSHRGKSEKAWTFLDPKFKSIYEGDFNEEDFYFRDFHTDTKASHYTRLQCAFVDFHETARAHSGMWHFGRAINKARIVNLIKHIEDKLPEA